MKVVSYHLLKILNPLLSVANIGAIGCNALIFILNPFAFSKNN